MEATGGGGVAQPATRAAMQSQRREKTDGENPR
jgi:hypothetical protein